METGHDNGSQRPTVTMSRKLHDERPPRTAGACDRREWPTRTGAIAAAAAADDGCSSHDSTAKAQMAARRWSGGNGDIGRNATSYVPHSDAGSCRAVARSARGCGAEARPTLPWRAGRLGISRRPTAGSAGAARPAGGVPSPFARMHSSHGSKLARPMTSSRMALAMATGALDALRASTRPRKAKAVPGGGARVAAAPSARRTCRADGRRRDGPYRAAGPRRGRTADAGSAAARPCAGYSACTPSTARRGRGERRGGRVVRHDRHSTGGTTEAAHRDTVRFSKLRRGILCISRRRHNHHHYHHHRSAILRSQSRAPVAFRTHNVLYDGAPQRNNSNSSNNNGQQRVQQQSHLAWPAARPYVSDRQSMMVLSPSSAPDAMMFSVGWHATHSTTSLWPLSTCTISFVCRFQMYTHYGMAAVSGRKKRVMQCATAEQHAHCPPSRTRSTSHR